MPLNEYVKSPEYVFIQYHDVIRSYKPYLLSKMLNSEDYRKGYDGYINFDLFKDFNDNQLLGLAMRSLDKNILKYLMLKPFNCDVSLKSLCDDFPDLFKESKLLKIGNSISMLLKQSYVQKIYIHTTVYDKRIHRDIAETFGDMGRIVYVTGDILDAINKIPEKITTYILNDVNIIDALIECNKISYSNVLVVDAGWNYKKVGNDIVLKCDDIEKKSQTHIFKTGTFTVDDDIVYST